MDLTRAGDLTPEAREARAKRGRMVLYRMWEMSGVTQDAVAPFVNMGPKDFSRAIAPSPHPDAEQRRRFPAEQIANYSLGTNSLAFLAWLLDELGFDGNKLQSIRKVQPSDRQLLEALASRQEKIQAEQQAISKQLSFLIAAPAAATKRKER